MQVTNSVAAVRSVLSQAESSISHANSAATQAEARAEHAERLLGILQAERADQAEKAEAEAKSCKERAEKAEEELRLMTLDRDICQSSLDTANVMKSVAEERAENAEEIARRSDTELAKVRLAIKSTLERATTAEGKMAEAIAEAATAKQEAIEAKSLAVEMERKVAKAVEDFKHSSMYEKEIIESTAFAYDSGFADCKAKVAKVYGLDGLDSLEPDEDDEEEPAVPPSDACPSPTDP